MLAVLLLIHGSSVLRDFDRGNKNYSRKSSKMKPIKSQYETYNKKFSQFLEALERRKQADVKKAELEQLRKVKMGRLLELSNLMTELQCKKTDLKQLQKEIQKKEEEKLKRVSELEKYRRICDDKVGVIQHHMKILQAFKRKFREDYEACQSK